MIALKYNKRNFLIGGIREGSPEILVVDDEAV